MYLLYKRDYHVRAEGMKIDKEEAQMYIPSSIQVNVMDELTNDTVIQLEDIFFAPASIEKVMKEKDERSAKKARQKLI